MSSPAILSLEFIGDLAAVVVVDSGTGVERIVDNHFHPRLVGRDDEPVQVVVVDQEDEFVVAGVVLAQVALVVREDGCFGVREDAGAEVAVSVVVVGSLDLLEILYDCGCDGVVEPLAAPQLLERVLSHHACKLSLKLLYPSSVEGRWVLALADVPAALDELVPVE